MSLDHEIGIQPSLRAIKNLKSGYDELTLSSKRAVKRSAARHLNTSETSTEPVLPTEPLVDRDVS